MLKHLLEPIESGKLGLMLIACLVAEIFEFSKICVEKVKNIQLCVTVLEGN